MKKYILILLLLVTSNSFALSDSELESTRAEVHNIILEVIKTLEVNNVYSQYPKIRDLKIKVHILNDSQYRKLFCRVFTDAVNQNELFSGCEASVDTEAFYSWGSFYFRDTLDLKTAYGVGTVVHESIHYVQEMHGLLSTRCVVWAEYEATRLEEKLVQQMFPYLPMPYSDKQYYAKWRNIYSKQLNEERTDCKL